MDTSEGTWSGLDAALHELGMLSAVTESRREYLREKLEKLRKRQSIVSLQVVAPDEGETLPQDEVSPCQGSSQKHTPGNVICGCLSSADIENNENSCINLIGRSDGMVKSSKNSERFGDLGGGFSVLQMNTQYITGVAVGAGAENKPRKNCCRPSRHYNSGFARHYRLKPYDMPWYKEERVRTKSENADGDTEAAVKSVPSESSDPSDIEFQKGSPRATNPSLYKSRSLESVPVSVIEDSMVQSSHELESVAKGMQCLYVNE